MKSKYPIEAMLSKSYFNGYSTNDMINFNRELLLDYFRKDGIEFWHIHNGHIRVDGRSRNKPDLKDSKEIEISWYQDKAGRPFGIPDNHSIRIPRPDQLIVIINAWTDIKSRNGRQTCCVFRVTSLEDSVIAPDKEIKAKLDRVVEVVFNRQKEAYEEYHSTIWDNICRFF